MTLLLAALLTAILVAGPGPGKPVEPQPDVASVHVVYVVVER